ncbi:MAG: ABC transporter permease [Cyclobacteriaceae bacterium]
MLKLVSKDLKIFIQDKKAVMLTFLLPIALISLFAITFGGMGGGSSISPVKMLIANQDTSVFANELVADLDSSKMIRIETSTLTEATEKVRKGDRVAALVIHHGVADSMAQGAQLPIELLFDPSAQIEYGILQQVLFSSIYQKLGNQQAKQKAIANIKRDYGYMDSVALSSIVKNVEAQFADGEASNQTPAIKETPLIIEDENSNFGLIQAVAGTGVMMLLFSVAGMGSSLLSEKEEGTLRRLLYTPLRSSDILFGKMLSTTLVAVAQLVVMFVFGWLVFGLDVFLNLPALLLIILATAIACASFGILLSAISKSRKQVEAMSTIIILVMSAIGGSMMPLPIMPEFMQKLAVISVNYWSIQGFYDIFWRQLEIVDMLPKIGILLLIAGTMIAVSYHQFKKNLLELA